MFIAVALILGDGLYNFVKVLSHTFLSLYSAWKIKPKLPITDGDGNVVSAETISFDDKRRIELFLKGQIPKKFALGGYVCLAIISIVTLPHIFKPLKWYFYTCCPNNFLTMTKQVHKIMHSTLVTLWYFGE